MQQYFVSEILQENDEICLNEDILHHLVKVLRKDSSYKFRLVGADSRVFFAHLIDKKIAHIDEFVDENNELDVDVTCVLSLIKMDKFELCIQKLVELGVKRIVPFEATRSVVKIRDGKKLERIRKIALEAAEQSHRNIVPEIAPVCNIKGLKNYLSKYNYLCYEAEQDIADITIDGSLTYIIGPEGGFDSKEYQSICDLGFKSVSLGKRILRAETAAIYTTSVIVSKCQ